MAWAMRGRRTRVSLAALCLAALTPACATTQQAPIKLAEIQTGNKCGLLGSDCNRLTAGFTLYKPERSLVAVSEDPDRTGDLLGQ